MTAPDYLTSLSCLRPTDGDDLTQWLRFLALSPCPQRLLFSAADLLFLLTLLIFALLKIFSRHRHVTDDASKPLLSSSSPVIAVTIRFKLALALASLLALAYAVLVVLAVAGISAPTWRLVESLFVSLQFLVYLASAALIAHEKRFRATADPLTLRIYWHVSLLLTALISASSVLRLIGGDPIQPDDYLSLISLPIAIAFLYFAVNGSTGVLIINGEEKAETEEEGKPATTGYATASVLSRATWHWINPLLVKVLCAAEDQQPNS